MAITTDQYNRLFARITKLEETMNNVLVAMDRLVSLTQVQQLLVLTQEAHDSLEERIDALETRVSNIEEDSLS